MANSDRGIGVGGVFLAFLAGAAIGGGVALLTSPRSGPENRDKLRDLADETREKINELTAEAEKRIREVVDEGRDSVTEKRDMIKAAMEAGREAMEAERAKHQKSA